MRLWLLLLWLTAAFGVSAQYDERRVVSPDGQLEFRLFVASQQDTALFRIAYQIDFKGKPVIDTSFMGLDLWEQEPLLGENDGLIGATEESNAHYHTLIAKYMQNGSLGRLLKIEARAYDGAIAFRYVIPKTNAVEQLLIADETTEFAVTDPSKVTITEVPIPNFPRMQLGHSEGSILLTRLDRRPDSPGVAWQGTTPFIGPWRVVVIDSTKVPSILRDLRN